MKVNEDDEGLAGGEKKDDGESGSEDMSDGGFLMTLSNQQ